ncbi:MAG: ABC transporter permease [Clostridia bacterium]|nr:ABC transporter permease [Clostridia bacterium]
MGKHKQRGAFSRNVLLEKGEIIIISIIAAFLVSIVFVLALGENPFAAYGAMLQAVGKRYGLAETIAKATPLVIISLGLTLAVRGGLSNLGGDGQFYMGAIASICVGIYLPEGWPPIFVWLLALAAGAIAGGLWGALAGFLRARFNTSEVIITIMLNYVSLYWIGYLVHGPLQAPGGIPQTRALIPALQFPKLIQGTRAHTGILIGILAALLVWFIFRRTSLGYRIQAVGEAPKAAAYGGINTKRYMVIIMGISGAFAGIAGMVEVYGVHYRVLEGITASFGFTALLIALLANLHPLGAILGSLFISALTVGANSMQIDMNVPTSIVNVVQSLIIFFMLVMPQIKVDFMGRFKAITRKGE